MFRPRSLLPASLLAAAALAGACQAPAHEETAAASSQPLTTPPTPPTPAPEAGPSAAAAIPPAPPPDMTSYPVSRVVLGGGLLVEDLRVGDGPLCEGPDSTITVRYRGELASTGAVFDATAPGETADLPLDRLIKGWKQGVPGMRVGGVRRLTVPAPLAYGSRGLVQGDHVVIPPNADLVFEIELLGVR